MDREEFIESVASLKHDLAKYVAWRSANLDEASWAGALTDEMVEALRADILETRKGRAGPEPAWQVWRSFSDQLPKPLAPELVAVEAAVNTLEACRGPLEAGSGVALADARPRIRDAQLEIRKQLRALHRRLLQEVD